MKKTLKWIGIGFGTLIGLLLVGAVTLILLATNRLNRNHTVNPNPINISDDADAIERGGYLYAANCAGCHGGTLGGKAVVDDPAIGLIPAPNLTSGEGGVVTNYTDVDYVRAIRHGVAPDGTALMVMPSKAYWHYSDEDLGAIIAFLKSAPSVNNDPGEVNIRFMGKLLMSVGAFGDVFSAEVIDHTGTRPVTPERSVSAAYGEYMVITGDCANCHGADLGGSQSPEPGSPFSSNLTTGGNLANWSASDFIETLRSGTTPEGHILDANYMPYEDTSRLNDDDLTAMFLYLQSLPAVQTDTN